MFRETHGGEGGSDEGLSLPNDLRKDLTSEQELIYKLADGTRTVQEIIDRSLIGKFNASEILSYLLEVGLIEIASVRSPSLVQKARRIDFAEVFPFAYLGGLLLLIFLLLVYLTPNLLHHLLDSGIERVDIEIPTYFAQQTQLDRIKNALEIFYLEKGSYPDRLEELVSVQLLKKSDLFYLKGISYQYELRDGKYLLKH